MKNCSACRARPWARARPRPGPHCPNSSASGPSTKTPSPCCWARPCRTTSAPAWRAAGWPMRRRWCHCPRACRPNCSPPPPTSAQAGPASDALSGLFQGGSWGLSIAPSLLLALFDAGRNQAQLEVSEAVRSIAVAQYEKTIQTAFREVSDALAGQATLGEQVQARQNQAQAEAASLRLAELRYLNGVASHLDLLDAQRSLFSTQQAVVQTRLAQLQNQVTLYKAL